MKKRKVKAKFKVTKADKILIEERINTVIKLKMMGLSHQDTCRYASEKWNISDRQTERYLEKATTYLHQCAKIDRDEEIGKAIARYNDLYGKSMGIQDYRECRAVQKAINELWGLEAPDRHEIAGKFSIEDLMNLAVEGAAAEKEEVE